MAVRSWIRTLFSPATTRSTPSFRPTFTALESRENPAVAVFSAGELIVTGASYTDAVQVFTQGQDMVVRDESGEILRTTANGVNKLTVSTGDGNDDVTVNFDGGVLASSLRVQINTGDGNDDVNCACGNIAGSVTSIVNMGNGDDSLVGTSSNSAATASHTERIDGGKGNDSIACIQVNPAGVVDTTMIGGNGDDTLFGNLVSSQTTANLSFTAIGDSGADAINLLAEGAVHGQLMFDIQGGNDADQIGLSFNLADPSTPDSLPPSTVTIRGGVNAGKGDDVVTVDPGNPFNLAQVQFPTLLAFDGGYGTDQIVVAGGIPLNMLPIAPADFEVM